jgi:hypothetical protein
MRCKNCGQHINRHQTSYWVHTKTDLVTCANGQTQAER